MGAFENQLSEFNKATLVDMIRDILATNAALTLAVRALLASHKSVEPHHEEICGLCRQASAALAKARGEA